MGGHVWRKEKERGKSEEQKHVGEGMQGGKGAFAGGRRAGRDCKREIHAERKHVGAEEAYTHAQTHTRTHMESTSEPTTVPSRKLLPKPAMKRKPISPRVKPYALYSSYTYGPCSQSAPATERSARARWKRGWGEVRTKEREKSGHECP